MRVWIDTDVGDDPDDAIALLCAIAHPGLEVVGVSTVDGDVDTRAAHARSLVGPIPVVAGPPPAHLHGADAVLLIGPWTHGPALVGRSAPGRRIVAMGAATRPVFHRGELRVVEHNLGRDPCAARALLDATSGIVVVPLDVTASMRCSRTEEAAMIRARPELGDHVARWRARGDGEHPLCLHDPLAVLTLAGDPGIAIDRRPMTVTRYGVRRSYGNEHDVVVGADRHAVVTRVLTLLGSTRASGRMRVDGG